MPVGRTFQPNFTQGRLSAEVSARVDLQAYAAGLSDALNLQLAVTGPARRRAGFLDLGPALQQDAPTRLIAFKRSTSVAYVLEHGEGEACVWTQDGALVQAGGAPYTFRTPFPAHDLAGIRYVQSNDVQFVTHASSAYPPFSLARTGVSTFNYNLLDVRYGPFLPENTTGASVTASASTGAVTLTGSEPLFQPGHVGTNYRLRVNAGAPSVSTWAPSTSVTPDQLVASDGKIYAARITAATKTGNTPPLHDTGTAYDGGVTWEYVHDGAGVIHITGYTDSRTLQGVVTARLPTQGLTSPVGDDPPLVTSFFSEGAWSGVRGWPQLVEELDERIVFAGSTTAPGGFWATRTAGFGPGYVDLKPGLGTGDVEDDDAISRTIGAGGEPAAWMISAAFLMIGTDSKERVAIGETWDDPMTPAATRFRPLSAVGAAPVAAVEADDGVVYVTRGGRGLRVVRPTAEQGAVDRDLTIMVQDLVEARIAEIAWAPHPDQVLWVRTEDGRLLSCTYDGRQNVVGWSRHELGGGFLCDSLAVLPDVDGRDTLWLTAVRTKGGAQQRRVWTQAPRWREGQDPGDAVYLDCAETYAGAAVGALAGLGHLEGETVTVFGDAGAVVQDLVVTGGAVTLADGATVSAATVGLRYVSRARSMPLDVPGQAGPGGTLGTLQRPTHVTVTLADAVASEVQVDGGGPPEQLGRELEPYPVTPGDVVERWPVGAPTGRRVTVGVQTDGVWPCTLLAVRAEVQSTD